MRIAQHCCNHEHALRERKVYVPGFGNVKMEMCRSKAAVQALQNRSASCDLWDIVLICYITVIAYVCVYIYIYICK